jgi:FkbM family methyltransferase
MANKRLSEPYAEAWLKWHLYRRWARKERYDARWKWIRFVNYTDPSAGIFVDCGANIGEISSIALNKGFAVHAFEPDPLAADALQEHLGANPRMTIHRAAVGAAERTAVLFRATEPDIRQTIHSSLWRTDVAGEGRAVTVPVIDIFRFIDTLNRPVAAIKLDIEGAEYEVLERMIAEDAWRDITHIFVESHRRFGPEMAEREDAIRGALARLGRTNVNFGWV